MSIRVSIVNPREGEAKFTSEKSALRLHKIGRGIYDPVARTLTLGPVHQRQRNEQDNAEWLEYQRRKMKS